MTTNKFLGGYGVAFLHTFLCITLTQKTVSASEPFEVEDYFSDVFPRSTYCPRAVPPNPPNNRYGIWRDPNILGWDGQFTNKYHFYGYFYPKDMSVEFLDLNSTWPTQTGEGLPTKLWFFVHMIKELDLHFDGCPIFHVNIMIHVDDYQRNCFLKKKLGGYLFDFDCFWRRPNAHSDVKAPIETEYQLRIRVLSTATLQSNGLPYVDYMICACEDCQTAAYLKIGGQYKNQLMFRLGTF